MCVFHCFFKASGIQEIIIPFETKSGQRWADFGEYKLILYPFIEGKDGFESGVDRPTQAHPWSSIQKIHTAQVPPELKELIRKEIILSEWRDDMKLFQMQAASKNFDDPTSGETGQSLSTSNKMKLPV